MSHIGRIAPKDQEVPFTIDELFFSRTDKKGIISSGNKIFVRVSGYPESKLIGSPHNIIRHPDMPRAVFKLFWETLQANQPIIAYVKNMAVDGRYYWVLAAAFPVEDGYFSLRLKPSTPLFKKVKELYAEVLRVEQKDGLTASYPDLLKRVAAAGFADYRALMKQALLDELSSRDLELESMGLVRENVSHGSVGCPQLAKLLTEGSSACERASDSYKNIFQALSELSSLNSEFKSGAESIRSSYEQIKFLSFNMAIESERAGEHGRALAVVSETFRKWAAEIQKGVEQFLASVNSLAALVDQSALVIASSRFQVMILDYFLQEILQDCRLGVRKSDAELQALRANCAYLVRMATQVFAGVGGDIEKVLGHLRMLQNQTSSLKVALNALRLIQQNGRIEASRLDATAHSFGTHLDEMQVFIGAVLRNVSQIETGTAKLHSHTRSIDQSLKGITHDFARIPIQSESGQGDGGGHVGQAVA